MNRHVVIASLSLVLAAPTGLPTVTTASRFLLERCRGEPENSDIPYIVLACLEAANMIAAAGAARHVNGEQSCAPSGIHSGTAMSCCLAMAPDLAGDVTLFSCAAALRAGTQHPPAETRQPPAEMKQPREKRKP